MFMFWALILLGVLVLVHELGHFILAKLTGVKVIRFSIGFGPKLLGFKIGETEYRISLVPLGGYVKMLAQESSEPIPAGITAIDPNGLAYSAGLRSGDLIKRVFDQDIENWESLQEELLKQDDENLSFIVEREEEERRFTLSRPDSSVPVELPPAEDGRAAGIRVTELGFSVGDHPEELSRAFFRKPLWARFAIVFAGPAASLLFPILIYFIYFLSIDEMTAARVGQVIADTPAARAGLEPGDRILAIGGVETPYWSSMSDIIRKSGGEVVELTILRGERTLKVPITPEKATTVNQIGDTVHTGRIGISAATIPAIVGPGGESSPAYKAGLRTGDRVVALNGEKINFIWELEKLLEEVRLSGRAIILDLQRLPDAKGGEPQKKTIKVVPTPLADGSFRVGVYSADTLVGKLEPDLPAAQVGLAVGDRILSVNGRKVSAWMAIEQVLRTSMDNPIQFLIESNGERKSLSISQKKEIIKGEYQEDVTRYRFGAWSAVQYNDWLLGERIPVENTVSFAAVSSVDTLFEITYMELVVFAKLFSGQVPIKMLGGPIMIFDVAGKAAEQSWQQYLWIMALISINLGILNLLPIPVLDGGHLMFFSIEALIRRPVNQRLKEKAIMLGFMMLMMLMVLVFKNDIERYWDVIFG